MRRNNLKLVESLMNSSQIKQVVQQLMMNGVATKSSLSLQNRMMERGFSMKISPIRSSVANTLNNHQQQEKQQEKQNSTNNNNGNKKKKSFFGKLLMIGGVIGGLLTVGYYYAKVTEKVSHEKFNDKSFTCVHRDGKTKKEILSTYRHHFQMSMPPIAMSSNMCVVDLGKSELMIYNPVELTDIVKNELKRLGKVKLIILPNSSHLKYASQYLKYFILENKDGKLEKPFIYCPYPNKQTVIDNLYSKLSAEYPELKKEDVAKCIYTLPSDNSTTPREWPRDWQTQFDLQVVTGLNLNEVVMCHKPTKTLIACDTVMDWKEPITIKVDDPNHTPVSVHYGKLLDLYGKGPTIPKSFRALITDKNQAVQDFTKIFTWNWEHIIMAHGNNLITQNPEQVRKLKLDYSEALSENLKL
ncbi:predicted protein [Naegleria gruberi]|uniref:Predicted protein n=1 Tax=Naegleria gruberi TaxID=5762 RepID=D2V348_NAEGR|nr:uncharacterized protein NAEGRDRAFT_63226 [Naegleria gruberi]EFC48714.1 predicted protein [Naegleria gruberi]|eukprot:XP_002681458.1 predicted protein [Naegleria gruberi strain NEG-M]